MKSYPSVVSAEATGAETSPAPPGHLPALTSPIAVATGGRRAKPGRRTAAAGSTSSRQATGARVGEGLPPSSTPAQDPSMALAALPAGL